MRLETTPTIQTATFVSDSLLDAAPETTESPRADSMHIPAVEQSELLAAAQSGDEAAFAILVSHYRPHAVSLARRLLEGFGAETEDVVQDSLMAVWRNIHSIEGYFWKYLEQSIRRRVMNAKRDWINRKTEYVESVDEDLAHTSPDAQHVESPEAIMLAKERTERIKGAVDAALKRLSPRYRLAIQMKELKGASYDDIAAVMHFNSRGRAKSFCNSARQAFQAAFIDIAPEIHELLDLPDADAETADEAPVAGQTLSLFG